MTDPIDDWLAVARSDGDPRSQARLVSRIAGASGFALAVASTRAALALEMKLALSGHLVPWVAGVTKAGVVGGVVGGAAATFASPAPPVVAQAEPATVPAVVPAEAPPSVLPGAETSAAAPPPGSRPAPRLVAAPERPSASRPAPSAGPSDLGPALALLDQARVAIARGDGASALRTLEAYPSHRGDGALDPEARLLRIVATKLAGRPTEAAAQAERWLAEEPDNPFDDALRAVTERHP